MSNPLFTKENADLFVEEQKETQHIVNKFTLEKASLFLSFVTPFCEDVEAQNLH